MKILTRARLIALVFAPVLALGFTVAAAPVSYAADPVKPAEPAFNQGITDGAGNAQGKDQATCLFGNEDESCEGNGIFKTVTNVLLFIIGAVSVIMLIIGGIRYTVSAGDSSAVTAAKNTIMYAIIGIIVAILAFAVVNFVITSFVPKTEASVSASRLA